MSNCASKHKVICRIYFMKRSSHELIGRVIFLFLSLSLSPFYRYIPLHAHYVHLYYYCCCSLPLLLLSYKFKCTKSCAIHVCTQICIHQSKRLISRKKKNRRQWTGTCEVLRILTNRFQFQITIRFLDWFENIVDWEWCC